jgi:hypothetical protein
MKKPYLILIASLIIAPVLISSNNGVAEDQNKDRTGAPGSEAPCSNFGCHASGAFSPTTTVEVLTIPDLVPVTEYEPGVVYRMRVTITAGSGMPSTYGFQATAVFDEGAANAGEFSNPGASVQLEAVGMRHIVEHSADTPSNTFVVDWTAPETGSGTVSFYCSAVASNNSNTTSGDGYDGFQLTITEASGENLTEKERFNAISVLNQDGLVLVNCATAGTLRMYDASGKLIAERKAVVGKTEEFGSVSGMVVFQLITESEVFSSKQLLR